MTFAGSASCPDLKVTRDDATRAVAQGAVAFDFRWEHQLGQGGRTRWANLEMNGSARGTVSDIARLLDWQPAEFSAQDSRFTAS